LSLLGPGFRVAHPETHDPRRRMVSPAMKCEKTLRFAAMAAPYRRTVPRTMLRTVTGVTSAIPSAAFCTDLTARLVSS
jgi:hypothetical protein